MDQESQILVGQAVMDQDSPNVCVFFFFFLDQ